MILFPNFSNELKQADIIPVHKTYKPTSILLNISKIYERYLYDQIAKYFENTFLKYQCCFKSMGCSAQYCLLDMIEK